MLAQRTLYRLLLLLLLISPTALLAEAVKADGRANYLTWRAKQVPQAQLQEMAFGGHLYAMIALGNCYLTGRDGKLTCDQISIETGLAMWERALKGGELWLADDLLNVLIQGPVNHRGGWTQNWPTLCRVAERVRKKGLFTTLDARKQSLIAHCYLTEHVTQTDPTFAISTLEKLGREGSKQAALLLAEIFAKGLYGFEADPRISKQWQSHADTIMR
uniref:Uncharacterized protein n=1 Tax=Magnetococcus massalia (strain MO-1) TaxID=451514 RepID=A0A1S7LNC4_MAGMO|nr:Conserved exported protein of unknown function [Candidatus Magnetococcus massalia]